MMPSKANISQPSWVPTAPEKTLLYDFIQEEANKRGAPDYNQGYQAFWQWSVDQSEIFWTDFWDWAEIIGKKGPVTLKNPSKMEGGQFFPEGMINYSENLLKFIAF